MSKERNNITVKVFALLIAIILWSFVMNKENPEWPISSKNIPVTINTNTLDRLGLVLMEPKEITINVEVTGRKNDMKNFSAKNIVAQVDLSGRGEGQMKVPINVSLRNQLPGVIVTNWEPKEVLFTLEKIISRDIPVNIQTEGEVPTDYLLGNVNSKSQFVSIRGPRSWVNEVDKVVAIVNVEDINSDTSRSITVKVLDDQGNEVIGVDKVPSLIDVNISVLKTNSIPIELITENKLPDNFTITNIEISPRNIAIKGKKDILGINKINTKPIDINSLLEQTSMEVELDLPEGVELLNPKEKILITYTIEETIVKDYNVLMKDLTIKNLDSTLSINDLDLERSIQIALKGIKSVIDKVTVEDLVVEIDLLGLEEGTHTVQLKVGNIQGVTVDAIKPEPLEIELIKN
jgi:YbbR domain-containing protein